MPVTASPQVSVVMPVHNALPYLDAAVESILGQTLGDFRFIILDDGSTDGSTERLRYWASRDFRITLLEEKSNLGPALSSQRVALAASTPFVARTDADDISYPSRLADQLAVFERFPGVDVVGGLTDVIDSAGRIIRRAESWRLLHPRHVPPFGNGPLMYRQELFDRVGGYRSECEYWEDHDLIIRMAAISKVMVLPYAVYAVRQSAASTRIASEARRVERAVDLMYRCRERVAKDRSYDDLLASSGRREGKLDPRVFISLGSAQLWSGMRPHLFRRLLLRGDLKFNFRTLSALVWAAWASAEPHTLRAFMRLLLMARNASPAPETRTNEPVLWRGGALLTLGRD
ncbi:glycosyltransferase family A protein [Sphingomonas sp.]|uniref:glycosyltransferase family 2 protein n=1 Tax=Sphingomonas sp. TaxID=28214 RepID=UPI0025F9D33D|nr:glycosyltransferase family A protein [Sphingomonas sp.]MBV9527160.1 glycosyltransferase family 2 protein [Sphingomonas sp.]